MKRDAVLPLLIKELPDFTEFQEMAGYYYDDDKDIMLNLVFSDVARWYLKVFRNNDANCLNRIHNIMEHLYVQGNDEVKTAVVTGFLEGVWGYPETDQIFKNLPDILRIKPF